MRSYAFLLQGWEHYLFSVAVWFLKPKRNRFEALTDEYEWLLEDEYDENGATLDYHNKYEIRTGLDEFDSADMIDEVLEFDNKLKALATEYYIFIDDLMRIRKVYDPFLEKLHSESRYLDNAETAQLLYDFNADTLGKMKTYEKLKPSGNMQLSEEMWLLW